MKKTTITINGSVVAGYKLNDYIFAAKSTIPYGVGTKQIWASYCAECGLRLSHHNRLKDVITDLKNESSENKTKLAKHLKTHIKRIPKTIHKGEIVKKINLNGLVDAILKEVNSPINFHLDCGNDVEKSLGNFKFDLNYIPDSKEVGNVSAYYVDYYIDPEMEMLARRVKPIKEKETHMSNIMLNYEYDYVSAEKEDDDGVPDYEILDAVEPEWDADAMLEDIVRDKYIPKGLKGANKIIGWFMSTIEDDPVSKMYQYCKAVKVDEDTMRLIKFKMGAKLPRLEDNDSENVGFMDDIYTSKNEQYSGWPGMEGIATVIHTKRSPKHMEFWGSFSNNVGNRNMPGIIHNLLRYGKKSTITKIVKAKEDKIITEGELEWVREIVLTSPDRATCPFQYPRIFRSKHGRNEKFWLNKWKYGSKTRYIFKDGTYNPPICVKLSPSISSPTDIAAKKPNLIVKVFPDCKDRGLKEGFVIGAAFQNGKITRYVSGRAFDTKKVLGKLISLYSNKYNIKVMTQDPRYVSYKSSWNSFVRHTCSHRSIPYVHI